MTFGRLPKPVRTTYGRRFAGARHDLYCLCSLLCKRQQASISLMDGVCRWHSSSILLMNTVWTPGHPVHAAHGQRVVGANVVLVAQAPGCRRDACAPSRACREPAVDARSLVEARAPGFSAARPAPGRGCGRDRAARRAARTRRARPGIRGPCRPSAAGSSSPRDRRSGSDARGRRRRSPSSP